MGATILLVDADTSNRSDWERLLQHYGYKVVSANDGRQALEKCPRTQPDLALIADALPGMSGVELCRRLKAAEMTRYTPVIMMLPSTDDADATRRREAQDAGVDDFWGRPGSRWEAFNRIHTLLQLKSYIDHQAESVILSLARSLEAKDPGTEGHSERLVHYSFQLGARLGLSEDELEVLRIAGLVHDIGKVAVPDAILRKPARLTPTEMDIIRQHPVVGESICAPLKSFRDALPLIRHHHERMDGSGYPDGLMGGGIPQSARILQTVDVYDALTTDRPYRKAMPLDAALSVMMSEAQRGWLDRSLVSMLADMCQSTAFRVPVAACASASCTA